MIFQDYTSPNAMGTLPQVVTFMLSHFSHRIGMRYMLQFFLFEMLRRRLPSLFSLLSSSLFGTPTNYSNSSSSSSSKTTATTTSMSTNPRTITSTQSMSVTSAKTECTSSPAEQQAKKILERAKAQFFVKDWRDISCSIREEVMYLFTLEKQLVEVTRNLNIEKKQQQWDAIKKETWCFVPFSIISTTLILTTQFLQEILKAKYADVLSSAYPALHEPKEIADSILHEFFEQIRIVGLKNIKAFCKLHMPKKLADLPITEAVDLDSIFAQLDEYLFAHLLKCNSSIKTPSDHKKRKNSMTLLRNNHKRGKPSTTNGQPLLSPASVCQFFNDSDSQINSHTQQSTPNKQSITTTIPYLLEITNATVLAHNQPILAHNAMLDIMQFFLGDIVNHKILTDTEFIEKHIEIVDCHCREQRYQPSLSCIPEAAEDEDFGYESDQSDSHDQYHLYNYTAKHVKLTAVSSCPIAKTKKFSFDNICSNANSPSSKQSTKHPQRKLSNDSNNNNTSKSAYRSQGFQEDIDHQVLIEGYLKKTKNSGFARRTVEKTRTSVIMGASDDDGDEEVEQGEFNEDYEEESFQMKQQLTRSTQGSQSCNQTEELSDEDDDECYETQEERAARQARASIFFDGEDEDYLPGGMRKPRRKMANDKQTNQNTPSATAATQQTSLEESIEILENRTRLAHFLSSLCYEALEMMESTNFQSYLYYAIAFQYKKFKNRLRLATAAASDSSSNIKLINLVVLINKVIEDHFLSEEAPIRCEQVYSKAKCEAEKLLQERNTSSRQAQQQQTMQHAKNIARIFDEMDQSRVIRESFDELSLFFMNQ